MRTPFALTGAATDTDGDPITYMWEQNDRGAATGTGLISNTKLNGPLFRQFGTRAVVTSAGTLEYGSPGENHTTSDPTRVFPDMAQILAEQHQRADRRLPDRADDADRGRHRVLLGVPADGGVCGLRRRQRGARPR